MIKATLIIIAFLLITTNTMAKEESICYGTTSNGRLKNGIKLPSEGNNYLSYSTLAGILGRTYVHSTVKDIIVESYKILEKEKPSKVYKYAETGFKEGGSFKPHKTHQNGLSVDFIVPVVNKQGKSVHLPTNPLNKWGYNIEFDSKGFYEEFAIDFEALGAHIVALHKTAKKHGKNISRVIFDPALQPLLFKSSYGEYIKENIKIPKKKSWVRHDEHYHVDFDLKCRNI